MKKGLPLCFLLSIIILKTIAQPTLTSANTVPNFGETFQNQYSRAANVDTLSGGANQTWNYVNLTDSSASVFLQVVPPSSTPNADSFPTSNLTIKTYNDSSDVYLNSQPTSLRTLGVITKNAGSIRYPNSKIYLPYPFTFNSFFTDSVSEESPSYPTVVLRGKDSLYGNGYGTLIIPGNTYNNVLRVKYIENVSYSQDTSIVIDTLLGVPVSVVATATINLRTVSYLYYTPDTHAPLLSFNNTQTTLSVGYLGIPIYQTTIESKDISYLKNYILPLSFVAFNAVLDNRQVSVQWQTAQEINTGHFNVQRSLTGNNFEDIAEVEATGKSTGARYNYLDQSFVKTDVPPAAYYRIKETDKDGKQIFSSIAVVHGNGNIVSLYPNPVKAYLNLSIKEVTVADAITIFDAKGSLVQQWRNYQISQPLNVSTLSKGTYFIQVKIKDKTTTTTVVKE